MVEVGEQNIRVYCPTHKTKFTVARGRSIICESGGEALAKDFPNSPFWEYCCDCSTFWPSKITQGHEAEDNCPSCERKISRRYLCHSCEVLSVQSDELTTGSPFILSPNGSLQPSCPGCSAKARTALSPHDCYSVFVDFFTARKKCPFCFTEIEHESNSKGFDPTRSQKNKDGSPAADATGAGHNNSKEYQETTLNKKFGARSRESSLTGAQLWLKTHSVRIKIIILILTIGGAILTVAGFPVIYSFLAWHTGKLSSRPPVLKTIDCKREVPEGENVSLKAIVEHQDGLKPEFIWESSLGRIEGNGSDVILNTSGVVPKLVPLRIGVDLKVIDGYGRSDSRKLDVYVVPIALLNKSPILKTIKCNCNTQEVRAGESVSLTAMAEDPDGDELVYEWRSSTGQIEGEGESITLNTSSINPQSNFAPVKVSLTIKDQRGSSVSNDIVINVVPKQAPKDPRLASPLSLEPSNNPPILVMLQPNKSMVEIGELIKLESLATDPNSDKLIYEWDSSKGQIEGGVPIVTLNTAGIAPQQSPDRIIITLTVRDGRGASVSGKAFITITQTPKPEAAQPSPTITPVGPLLISPTLINQRPTVSPLI